METLTHRFEFWATSRVGIDTGLVMLSAQAANEVLRHCRIGRLTMKVRNG